MFINISLIIIIVLLGILNISNEKLIKNKTNLIDAQKELISAITEHNEILVERYETTYMYCLGKILQEAIEQENYEKAAECKKYIEAFEAKIKESNNSK